MHSNFGLPLLPGFLFNTQVGRRNFHKPQHFESKKDHSAIAYKSKAVGFPVTGARLFLSESPYPKSEKSVFPAWIVFDKKVLCFECYFQEMVPEGKRYSRRTRKCKLLFFLEDETLQVVEPKIPNSGIAQGTLISRHKIRRPGTQNDEFYNILDLNVGREIDLYGRIFTLTNCDKFTRSFLNQCGIAVPGPIEMPEELDFLKRQEEKTELPQKRRCNQDKFGQFLQYDRQVLRFKAYWDDSEAQGGFVHDLNLYYYLANDSIEIRSVNPSNSGKSGGPVFLSRRKLPKVYTSFPSPGWDSPYTILNVFSSGSMKGRLLTDPQDKAEEQDNRFYLERDLIIGSCINVYGRKVVLTDCDEFTKEFYCTKYGLSDFTANTHGDMKDSDESDQANKTLVTQSTQNECHGKEELTKQYENTKISHSGENNNNNTLRFKAVMVSNIVSNELRDFIVGYHFLDNSVTVHEVAKQNTGFRSGRFFSKGQATTLSQEINISNALKKFDISDFYIGNIVVLNQFLFRLVDADEHTLRYLEANTHRFTKSNPILTMNKVRDAMKPKYKEFVSKYFLVEPNQFLPVQVFQRALYELLGNDITEHEVITLCRYYKATKEIETFSIEQLKSIVHTELKRYLFEDFERLEENFLHKDPSRTGLLERNQVYASLRGVNLPIDKELIYKVLDKMSINSSGKINYTELLNFINYKRYSVPCSIPINIKKEFSSANSYQCYYIYMINIEKFLEDIALETSLVTQSS